MVSELWKLVYALALTFANALICLSLETRALIELQQSELGRMAVGCHGTTANEAVQGNLGLSSFEAKEASRKLALNGSLRFIKCEHWDRCV